MTDHTHPRSLRRNGFTLVEVLIVVTVMGVISAAIAAVFSVIVRTTPPTEARADDSRSLLGISTWLPADVAATPRAPLSNPTQHWDTAAGRTSGCSGTDPGINLLRLHHRENVTGVSVRYYASYRLVDDGGASNIVRVTCVNGGTAEINNVTAGLPLAAATPVVVTWKTETDLGVDYVIGVEMEIRTFDGDTLRVDASSRNPNQTLNTIPSAVTTVPAPTTTTTSTTTTTTTSTTTTTTTDPSAPPPPPPPPNEAPSAGPAAGTTDPGIALGLDLPVSDPNATDALIVTFGSVPDGWSAQVVTADATQTATDVRITPHASATPNTYTLAYTVTDPGGLTANSIITVEVRAVPCTASFSSMAPNPVENTASGNGNGNQVGQLKQAVTVTVTKSGNCSQLALRYTRVSPEAKGNAASDDDLQPQIDLFGDSITLTFKATSTERWEKGNRLIELVSSGGLPEELVHATRTLEVD